MGATLYIFSSMKSFGGPDSRVYEATRLRRAVHKVSK